MTETIESTAVDLVPVESQPTTLWHTDDPLEVVARATKVADALKGVLTRQGLTMNIKGRHHVLVEGWSTLGSMIGVVPVVAWSRRVEPATRYDVTVTTKNGTRSQYTVEGYDWEARVEARTLDGRVIGAAEAICSRAENTWAKRDDYALRSMAQCVPVDAEILTRRGFKGPLDIEVGEEVLAYDTDRDMTVWTQLEGVNLFADAPTVRVRSRSFDFACTPDHKWAVRGRNAARLVPLNEMAKAAAIIMAAPLCHGNCCTKNDLPIGERDAAIIGWLVTDGTIRQPANGFLRAHIDQSKPYYVEELQALLGADVTETVVDRGDRTFPSGVAYKTRPAHRFAFKAAAFRAFVERTGYRARSDAPGIAARLSPVARKAMFAAMLAGDGHNKRGGSSWRFAKQDPDAFEAFQILATLEGYALGAKSPFTMVNGNQMPTQMARVNRVCHVAHFAINEDERQVVWCPTTKFGTWVMRYRGNVAITGNTRATSKALRGPLGFVVTLAGYESTPAEEMPADHDHTPVPELPLESRIISVEQRDRVVKAVEDAGATMPLLLDRVGALSVDTLTVGQVLEIRTLLDAMEEESIRLANEALAAEDA